MLELGAGGLSDLNRAATRDVINGPGLNPSGATSIGDGIFEGRAALQAAPGTYDGHALVVLTDGVENSPRRIADVAAQIDQTTYAVGLGTPQNTSAPALQALSGNTGGFLLVTGAITGDNRFLLQKHFLQILAGVSGAEVVLDPDGALRRGEVHRIPFTVSDGDSGLEVVLLTERPDAIDFRLQTPNGFLLEPWRARVEPTMQFELGEGVGYYRLTLPTQLLTGRFDQSGTWHAVLTLGRPRFEPTGSWDDGAFEHGTDLSILRPRRHRPVSERPVRHERVLHPHERAYRVALAAAAGGSVGAAQFVGATASGGPTVAGPLPAVAARGLAYSLVVHAYSDVHLGADVEQSGFEPGARVVLSAAVTQSGLPLDHVPAVWAQVGRPDGTSVDLDLAPSEPGRFSADFVAASPGVHRVRVRARGRTRRGMPWERERTVTAVVWRGGDREPEPDRTGVLLDRDRRLCALVRCLLDGADEGRLAERLAEYGVDLRRARECLEEWCSSRGEEERR